MLSTTTLELLADLQAKSSEAYDQGGLLYTYTEAANQALTLLPESSNSAMRRHFQADNLNALARFLQASQGDYLSSEPTDGFQELAGRLVRALEADLGFDDVVLFLEDGGHDMTADIKMAKRGENRFFELSLFWSID